jgi:hypothetical protein
MAKATVIEAPQPKPPIRVQLDLSLEEAACVAQICGLVSNTGPLRNAVNAVYKTLTGVPRIECLRNKLDDLMLAESGSHQNLNIGRYDIPKED